MYYKRFFNAIYGGYDLEYCYTLEDLFKDEFNNQELINFVPNLNKYADLWFTFDETYWGDTGAGGKLWGYIYAKNHDHVALTTHKEWHGDTAATRKFWVSFYKIWKSTHGYYEVLIDLMKDNEKNLMAAIKTTTETESRFNDLPDQSGDYSGINYSTNLTAAKVTTATDAGTVLDRLEEVRRRYNDYYEKWAREFDKLFISPLNFDKKINEEEIDE